MGLCRLRRLSLPSTLANSLRHPASDRGMLKAGRVTEAPYSASRVGGNPDRNSFRAPRTEGGSERTASHSPREGRRVCPCSGGELRTIEVEVEGDDEDRPALRGLPGRLNGEGFNPTFAINPEEKDLAFSVEPLS